LPASLSFDDLAIASLPQFLPLFWLVGYFCRAGLVTNNVREFSQIPDLTLENWVE
jgi:hypothetical protein